MGRVAAWGLAVVAMATGCAGAPIASETHTVLRVPEEVAQPRSPGHLREHAEDLQERLRNDPRDADLWHELGLTQYRRGLSHAAVASFRRAEWLRPDDPETAFRLAQALAGTGERSAALALVEKLRRRQPRFAEAHALAGWLLVADGHPEAARDAWEAGWQCVPPSIDAGRGLAALALRDGDQAAARTYLSVASSLAPDDEQLRGEGASLAGRGRSERSVAYRALPGAEEQ